MLVSLATMVLMARIAIGAPMEGELEARQSCPSIQIFGARETTAPAGYGTASVVVNLILQAFPGSQAQAISYPACGGQAQCGGVAYSGSVQQGTAAVASAVNSFNQRCPNAQIVLVGYSQGGEIIGNAFCGGPDSGQGINTSTIPISAAALGQIKAVIEQGSPRFRSGLSYNVGTCTASGFSARPVGYSCPSGNAKIQSYCDAADPYCCTGSDANAHQQYGAKYGQNALTFVKSKLNQSSGGTTPAPTTTRPAGTNPTTTAYRPPTTTTAAAGTGGGACSALYGQCGGNGFNGPKCCSAGTCKKANDWYSQCL